MQQLSTPIALKALVDRLAHAGRSRLAWRRPGRAAAAETESAAETDENAAPVDDRLDLEIVFSDIAWRLRLRGSGADAHSETRAGDLFEALAAAEDVDFSATNGLRAALRSLAPGERAAVGAVSLYPVTPEIELFDNRAIRAFSNEAEALRRIADGLTGASESAFGHMAIGPAMPETQLVSVCPLDLLRRYVTALGDLAPRLRVIAPGDVAAFFGPHDNDGPAQQAWATLHLGAHASMIAIADPANGIVASRSAPIGAAAFAQLIADANSLPLEEATREMGARDMAARAVAAGLDAPLEALVSAYRDLTNYVCGSRLGEAPAVLRLCGGHAAVKGVDALLATALGVQVEKATPTPEVKGSSMNLLESTVGPLFVQGAEEYAFVDGRFVASAIDERAARPTSTPGEPRRIAGITLPRLGDGDASPGRLAALAGVAGLLGVFVIYDLALEPIATDRARAYDRYGQSVARIGALSEALTSARFSRRQDVLMNQPVDKLLWAEKFVAIAEALPRSLWLKEATVSSETRRIGKVEVVATKLALRGVAQSGGERRLQDIAQFIDRLEADPVFMRDFRSITFAGLTTPDGDRDTEFEIFAWYDENKRKSKNPGQTSLGAQPLKTAASDHVLRAEIARNGGQ